MESIVNTLRRAKMERVIVVAVLAIATILLCGWRLMRNSP